MFGKIMNKYKIIDMNDVHIIRDVPISYYNRDIHSLQCAGTMSAPTLTFPTTVLPDSTVTFNLSWSGGVPPYRIVLYRDQSPNGFYDSGQNPNTIPGTSFSVTRQLLQGAGWTTGTHTIQAQLHDSCTSAPGGKNVTLSTPQTITISTTSNTCNVQYAYFMPVKECTTFLPTDSVDVRCMAQFTGSYVGQQFLADIIITDPGGASREMTSGYITTALTTIFSIPLRNYTGVTNPDGTLKSGTYSITNVLIIDSGGYTICQGAGRGSGQCESITVSGGGGCPLPSVSFSLS